MSDKQNTRPAPESATLPEFEPADGFEAHLMTEAAVAIHNRLVRDFDALPWWRWRRRQGIELALLVTGGCCYEFAARADRLDDDESEHGAGTQWRGAADS